MLMFRFWGSDSRGSEKTVDAALPMPLFAKPVQAFLDSTSPKTSLCPTSPLKRRRLSVEEIRLPACAQSQPPVKRVKTEDIKARLEQAPATLGGDAPTQASTDHGHDIIERAKDVIQFQLGLEILFKHDELRLINQELAKCQIALEQLRRCHLIPYPVTCPTPEQMLEISSGKGPAMRTRPGEPLPEWAPPFGVVDGPYARHYAKWLIPDPKFDGILPEWHGQGPPAVSSRTAVEGRTTRNSYGDTSSFGKSRQGRGAAGQKLHALSAGYPQPKDKAGPCILKRSDGKTVKLVCIDCHRENFSSTQGFINHCRIAHKRDFKSHDEAAMHCGHSIEVDEAGGAPAAEERVNGAAPPPPTPASGLVHPYARSSDISEQEAYTALRARIEQCLRLVREGKSPPMVSGQGAIPVPTVAAPSVKAGARAEAGSRVETGSSGSFIGADATPFLSRLMKRKNYTGNLSEHVADAKTKEEIPDLYTVDEDSEDCEPSGNPTAPASPVNSGATRTPGVMRMPARAAMAPTQFAIGTGPGSSKGCSSHLVFETPVATPTTEMAHGQEEPGLYEDVMDVDLSPNTMTSNNAPSLVSDDGDDSDDGSSSDVSDSVDADSVTEINLEDDHMVPDQVAPRSMRKSSTSVGIKKDETRHVTFVSPVRRTGKARGRKQNVRDIS